MTQNTIARTGAFLRRRDSQSLQGIAILMMIFHHCFCIPDRLGSNYIPVWGSFVPEMKIAALCKLCVAFFVFVSGYGMARASRKNHENRPITRLRAALRKSFKQLVRLYSIFWLVCLIFIPMGLLFFHLRPSPRELIKAVTLGMGISMEWWYILQYLGFMAAYPLLDLLTQPLAHSAASPARKTGAAALLVLFIGQFWALLPLYHRFFCSGFPEYMILFSLAYLIGRFRVYEQLAARLRLPGLCCALCIAALLALRWFWAKEPGQCDCDIFIAPLLLFALVEWMRAPFFEARLAPAARFLGKYSTFIWLSHTFWIYYYFQPVVLLPRYSILIYLWSVLLSLLTAMALSWIYGRCVEKGVRKITARLEM